MNQRRFEHSNNPVFASARSVLLLPFGRRSFLPAIVDAYGGEAVPLDETTDREVFRLIGAPSDITLVYRIWRRLICQCADGRYLICGNTKCRIIGVRYPTTTSARMDLLSTRT